MKKAIRATLDIAMPVLMLLLMAYTLVGKAAHEWIGLALLGIIICHNLLNRASGISSCTGYLCSHFRCLRASSQI